MAYSGKRKSRGTDANEIRNALKYHACLSRCKLQCTEFCKHLDAESKVMSWREKYHKYKRGPAQQTALMGMIKMTWAKSKGFGYSCHLVDDFYVCRTTFYKVILGIGKNTYWRALSRINKGQSSVEPQKRTDKAYRKHIIIGYLQSYFRRNGDICPETGKTILPSCITKSLVFDQYLGCTEKVDALGFRRFCQIWDDRFGKDVAFRKVACGTVKCDVCMTLQQNMKEEKDVDKKRILQEYRSEHLQRQRREREAYYNRRADSADQPAESMSIISDGMDQAKTNIPHFKGYVKPKALDTVMRTHVTGTIVHGKGTQFFVDLDQIPHDCNLVCHSIIQSVVQHSGTHGKLPKILHVQLDNCFRENKNVYMFGFCAYLVALSLFKEVTVNFLLKGHTHDDVDQRFSNVSKRLKRTDAVTLPELLDELKQSMPEIVKSVAVVSSVYDIKSWLKPHINKLYGHSRPHVFRFFKDKADHVALQYKHLSTDKTWSPSGNEAPLEIFRLTSAGSQSIPQGRPQLVDVSYEKQNFEGLRKTIKSIKGMLTFDQYSWWCNFLEDPASRLQDMGPPLQWLPDFVHTELDACDQTSTQEATDVTPVTILLEKERSSGAISSGKVTVTNKTDGLEPGAIAMPFDATSCIGKMVLYECLKTEEASVGEVIDVSLEEVTLRVNRLRLHAEWKTDVTSRYILISKDQVIVFFELTASGRIPQYIIRRIERYGH